MSPQRPSASRRVRIRVEGTVQGVGFRPYVFRLASELGLGGFVLNDERGVLLEVEGPGEAVEGFLARLPAEAPPLASIDSVASQVLDPVGRGTVASASWRARAGAMPTPPSRPTPPTCEECLAEVLDPADRRHRYPFTNCTNCGPRFTIVRGVPYDRPLTTMAGFEMCERCRAEYEDPADRRFHAQPNACPDCGPRARLRGRGRPRVRPARDAGRGRRARAARGPDPGRQGHRRIPPLLPSRRRGRGVRAALAQAPRGQAVRADGRERRGGAGARRARPSRGRAARRARAADRGRAPRGRWDRGGGVRRTRQARPRRDAPLLAAPPPAGRRHGRPAGDDERQRLRRADRLPRRGRPGTARSRSPTSSSSTIARSRPGPTTRSCARPPPGG